MKYPFSAGQCMALVCTFCVLFTCAIASAEDWTSFRGPGRSGIKEGVAAPVAWSDTENLAWKTPLPGPGSSSPILVGDRVFVTCFSGYGTESGSDDPADLTRCLLCLDRKTGGILWKVEVKAELPEDEARGFINEHGYASSTPTSDGERVFAFFGKSGVHAFDLDGGRLWHKDVGHESSDRRWGSAASPILVQDVLIVNASEESLALYGLDPKTGEEKWKTETQMLEQTYATPLLAPGEDGRTELVLGVPREIWGLNPKTGKLRWFAETELSGNVSPSPVFGDGLIYVFGGRPAVGAAVRPGGEGDVTSTHVAWTTRDGTYVPTPLYHEGRLYFVSDTGLATCLDSKTGRRIYRERVDRPEGGDFGGKPFYASPVLVGDRLYMTSRRAGTFVLPLGDEYKLLAQNRFESDDSDFNATGAVDDQGRLYFRSNRALYCVEEKKENNKEN